MHTGGFSPQSNASQMPPSGLLAIVLHFLELRIQHIVFGRVLSSRSTLGTGSRGAGTGTRRGLLVHLLHDSARGLLQRRRLTVDVIAVIAAHRALERRHRIRSRLLLIVGDLVAGIL